MEPTHLPYPAPEQMRHGDILLPRRMDAQAIASPLEQLQAWWRASLEEHAATAAGFDLVAYWPKLLGYLRHVANGDWTINFMLARVRLDLGSDFNPDDVADAIIGHQYVGHCAVVDMDGPGGEPWIVESSHTHGGVRSARYAEWVQERKEKNALVWLYRIHALADNAASSEEVRARRKLFVDTAHRCRMQGIRYAIFDGKTSDAKFCLDMRDARSAGDEHYLYCSELVLVCADALKAVPGLEHLNLLERADGTQSASKATFPMFTPKDIGLSKYTACINAPGGVVHGVPTADELM